MRFSFLESRFGLLCTVALILACAVRAQIGLAQADEKLFGPSELDQGQFAEGPRFLEGQFNELPYVLFNWTEGREGQRYLGLHVREADPALRAQLGLDKRGLIVVDVAKDSPADKAGLKRHDVLIAIGGTPLEHVKELTKAVDDAAGKEEKELPLKILRGGKEQELTVTPAERTQDVIRFVSPGGRAVVFSHSMGPRPMGSRPPLPDDVTLTIERTGKEPAKITVKRGDERWEVSEGELEKLPEDVRGLAAAYAGGAPMMIPFGGEMGPKPFTVRVPPPGAGAGARREAAFPQDAVRRLDEVAERVERLGDEIRRLRESGVPPKPAESKD